MCETGGCSAGAVVTLLVPGDPPDLDRHDAHRHAGEHTDGDEQGHIHVGGTRDTPRTVELQQKVLAKNDELADANRTWLRDRRILAVNLMSSPGSGKTTLLERTSRELAGTVSI